MKKRKENAKSTKSRSKKEEKNHNKIGRIHKLCSSSQLYKNCLTNRTGVTDGSLKKRVCEKKMIRKIMDREEEFSAKMLVVCGEGLC